MMMKSIRIAAALLGLAAPMSVALAHGGAAQPGAGPAHEEAEDTPFGQAGDPAKVTRTIDIRMSDAMRFDPAQIRVHKGETVRIVAHDEGKLAHEIVLGTMDELEEHAALMRKFPNMEHDEPHMAHVEPGQRKEIVWRFTQPGQFYYACLVPGHMEAGMIGKVIVAAALANAERRPAPHVPAKAQDAHALSQGTVRSIDKEHGKLTIRHGPLENLGMPGMTMVFRVKDPAMLDEVKMGESIRFRAEQVDGNLTVTQLQTAR